VSIRFPAVAGQFYPSEGREIKKEIDGALEREKDRIDLSLARKRIFGGVSPHAGYVFCLREAVHLFKILSLSGEKWATAVVLNPNHTGRGRPLSIDLNTRWMTPLGGTDIDEDLADYLIRESEGSDHPLYRESQAHKREHAGEVILPLLQYFLSRFSLLPLCMGDSSYGAAAFLAELLSRRRAVSGSEPLIIASSDFTHYESPSLGKTLDDYALEAILNLDTRGFYRRVGEKRLSICGSGPIMVLLEYAKRVTSRPAVTLLRRGHSGESDYFEGQEQDRVVDYVSLLVHEE